MTPILGEGLPEHPPRCAVAVARFHQDITEALLEGCLQGLQEQGAEPREVTVARVPGAWELPLACDRLAASRRYDAVIALGCVVRGETPHFDYVAGECARGLQEVALRRGLPVVFGVLTTDTLEQARWRADRDCLRGSDPGSAGAKQTPRCNKGYEAAAAALQMVRLLEQI